MRLWVSKNSEVPVRDQLVAQITLGVASGDLTAGERLPSTRELARRFHIHQNTVSSAYRELVENGLVEFKKGSGVFVANGKEMSSLAAGLERLFARFFLDEAVIHGYSTSEIHDHLRCVLATKPPIRFLVVESDAALCEIIIDELRDAIGFDTSGIALENFSYPAIESDTQIVAMFDEREKLQKVLPPDTSCIYLNANSVPNSLSGEKRPSDSDLIAIISGWDKFVSFAKLFLLAAKIAPETFITRSTAARNWKKGIDQASLIICDSLTAKEFPSDKRVRVFPLIAETSFEQLRRSTAPTGHPRQ